MLISRDEGLVEMGERGEENADAPAEAPTGEAATGEQKLSGAGDGQDEGPRGEVSGEEQEFLQRYGPVMEEYSAESGETPLTTSDQYSSIFTGSIAAVERNREFAGPGEDAYRERRERQEEHDGDAEDDEEHHEPRG